jgi:CBS domain-containing protein
MKVSKIMTWEVQFHTRDQTIQEAAQKMSEEAVGGLPIAAQERLIGIVTDREITIRAVGEGKSADTKLRQIMTPEIRYCFADEELDHVSPNMGEIQMRRLPVMNRRKKLVRIILRGDLAT